MTDSHVYDVAVVGLGLIGSGALRHLADEGHDCVGIGPAEPTAWATHTGVFASHYDSGRITRHLDPVREWAVLARRAIAGYADLETRSGIAFHRPVGVVLAELHDERTDSVARVATDLAIPVTTYAPERADRYDARLSFTPGSTLFSEPGPAGHVDPRRMKTANLTVAVAVGAVVIEETAVSLEHVDGTWQIGSDHGATVRARRVVVATGAHSDEIRGLDGCPRFDVRGETIVMAVLGDDEQERLAGMSSVLSRLDHPDYEDLYVVPPTDYPDDTVRLKLGATLRSRRRLDDGASRRRWMSGDDHLTELGPLRDLLTSLVPGLRAERWESKPCLITETSSGLPVVDHLAPGLVLAAGGNGYAAKSANAIGALAARLAIEGRWDDDELDARLFGTPAIDGR